MDERTTIDDLIDNAGIVRGLSFMPASEKPKRAHALQINLGRNTEAQTIRTFTLRERDFDEVFDTAVREIAEWRGVTGTELVDAMLATRKAFMKYYGLTYLAVAYKTVSYDPDKAKRLSVKRASRH